MLIHRTINFTVDTDLIPKAEPEYSKFAKVVERLTLYALPNTDKDDVVTMYMLDERTIEAHYNGLFGGDHIFTLVGHKDYDDKWSLNS